MFLSILNNLKLSELVVVGCIGYTLACCKCPINHVESSLVGLTQPSGPTMWTDQANSAHIFFVCLLLLL